MEKISNGRHEFEVVDCVPAHYFIWNIGKNMVDGYLPMCEWLNPANKMDFSINPNTLKAIKCPEAQTILAAIGDGQNVPWKMEAYIEKHADAPEGTWEHTQVERMRKALPVLKSMRIWGNGYEC